MNEYVQLPLLEVKPTRLVINELHAWRKRLRSLGAEVMTLESTVSTHKGWQWVAVAYNPRTGRDQWLLVKEGDTESSPSKLPQGGDK